MNNGLNYKTVNQSQSRTQVVDNTEDKNGDDSMRNLIINNSNEIKKENDNKENFHSTANNKNLKALFLNDNLNEKKIDSEKNKNDDDNKFNLNLSNINNISENWNDKTDLELNKNSETNLNMTIKTKKSVKFDKRTNISEIDVKDLNNIEEKENIKKDIKTIHKQFKQEKKKKKHDSNREKNDNHKKHHSSHSLVQSMEKKIDKGLMTEDELKRFNFGNFIRNFRKYEKVTIIQIVDFNIYNLTSDSPIKYILEGKSAMGKIYRFAKAKDQSSWIQRSCIR
jgi:hypothetical protein